MMQVLSNGQYRSIQHRAIKSTTAARLSVAYFLRPGVSNTLMQAALYRPFTWAEFAKAGKSLKDQGWSHPGYPPLPTPSRCLHKRRYIVLLDCKAIMYLWVKKPKTPLLVLLHFRALYLRGVH